MIWENVESFINVAAIDLCDVIESYLPRMARQDLSNRKITLQSKAKQTYSRVGQST